ncbi:MAG: ATP-binding protein [Desulfobacterales bacterium]|nr:ATP-binding protein [Desulfobacterales bacterium]
MIKNALIGQKAERDDFLKGNYVSREGVLSAKAALTNTLIKVIMGPRRAGKSIFAIQMLKGVDFAYVNFDDERLADTDDFDELLKSIIEVYGETEYLLFDEIQNVKGWELFVNRLHRRGKNLIVTGSNSKLLSRELATHLTGRYIPFQVLPFSFPEFLLARNFDFDDTLELKERQGLLLRNLSDYLSTGGYPEIVTGNLDGKHYLATLFDSILFKDIVKRYNVRYAKKLYDLGRYLITSHSSLFSYNKLKNLLEIRSVHTVENYLEYLKEAYLIFNLDRFSDKVKESLKSPRKAYAYDLGIINSVKFKISPDIGRLLENLVAIELLRREKEFYYYKTRDGKEVDFAIKEGLAIAQLFQVCYEISDKTTRNREINSLIKVAKETGCNNLMILTWDFEGNETIKGKDIVFLPIWKWLLQTS